MSNKRSNEFATFLSLLAKQASSFSDADIQNVLAGNAELTINISAPKAQKNKPKLRSSSVDVDVDTILTALNEIETRYAATEILSSINKMGLEKIARLLDISIQKSDKVDELRLKIVESTVGARLRSSAIQGNSSNE